MIKPWKQFDHQNAKIHFLNGFAFCQKEYISSAKVSLTGDMKWNFTSGVQPLHFRREGCRRGMSRKGGRSWYHTMRQVKCLDTCIRCVMLWTSWWAVMIRVEKLYSTWFCGEEWLWICGNCMLPYIWGVDCGKNANNQLWRNQRTCLHYMWGKTDRINK